MSDNLLLQTQSREIASIALLADCTFSSKAIKECFQDFQDPKFLQETELNYLREQNRKILQELSKANTLNKDLKSDIATSERKISQKDREIVELKTQCGTKGKTSRKLQEIDLNLPRPPSEPLIDENTTTAKYMKTLTDYESSIKKLTSKNKSLKKELEIMTERLKSLEKEKAKESKNDYHHNFMQELASKLKESETRQERAEKENLQLKDKLEQLNGEASHLRKQSVNLKKNYEDLIERYESLELTMSSNKEDYSTESAANSETTGGSNAANSKRSIKKDAKLNLEGMDFTLQGKECVLDFGEEECKKIVQEIMEIYRVKTPTEIIPSIKKMERVVHLVPKLRKVVSDVAAIVLPRAGRSHEKGEIELIVPSLRRLVKEIEQADLLTTLKNKLIEILELEKDASNIEIVKKVDKLATSSHQICDTREQSHEGLDNSLLNAQFVKIFGIQPTTAILRQISKQVEDYKHVINTVKYKLKLEADAKTEVCLNQLFKSIENNGRDKQAAEITYRLQGLLNCGMDSIVHTIERMTCERKKKDGL